MGIFRRWWFYPLAAVLLIAIAFAVLQGSQDDRNVSRDTFVADARAGVVDRVWVASDDESFTYTTRIDSVTYHVDNPAQVPVRESCLPPAWKNEPSLPFTSRKRATTSSNG